MKLWCQGPIFHQGLLLGPITPFLADCWLIHGCHWQRYQFWHKWARSLKDCMKGKWKAISWLTAPVNVVSFLAVSIMLSSITMDITCYSQFSFGYWAWLNWTWPRVLTKQMARAWIYTLWLWKKRLLKYSYPHKDQPKSKQQLAYAATWNQLAWWDNLNAIKSSGVWWGTLAQCLSWLIGFLINRTCCSGR